MLVRLIYASTVRDGVGLAELSRILQQSQQNNMQRDLTGVLAFNSRIVLQALEGGREQVNALYAKLLRDDRHNRVEMLKYAEIAERQWPTWSMGFAAPHADSRAVFLRHSPTSNFDPYALGGDQVERMLLELAGKTIAMTVPGEAYTAAAAPALAQGPASVAVERPRAIPVRAPAVATTAAQPAAANLAASATRPAPAASSAAPRPERPEATAREDGGFFSRMLGSGR